MVPVRHAAARSQRRLYSPVYWALSDTLHMLPLNSHVDVKALAASSDGACVAAVRSSAAAPAPPPPAIEPCSFVMHV